MQYDDDRKRTSRVIAGGLLVFVGGLFFLQNLGVLHAGRIGDYWPLLLVWLGLTRLLGPRRAHHFASGAVLVVLGVLFQLDRLGVVWFHIHDLWPVLLVIAGIALITESYFVRRWTGGGAIDRGPVAGPEPHP
ncbi:MAG: DUF5668 domain-containing protein [Acidobacteria bacterium]|nr:DUF5668 domain-containing protein [Acidobacteriota bacterium]